MNTYKQFSIGGFNFKRDDYFVYISWPTGSHIMPVELFLRALMRDVAWEFFYGTVNFDGIFGTINHYGTVDIFAGIFNENYKLLKKDYLDTVETSQLLAICKEILSDWCPTYFDPFAAPSETGVAWGKRISDHNQFISRKRVTAKRMVGLPDDTPLRNDKNGYPINRHFNDVPQNEPVVHVEEGFKDQLYAFNLFAYLSRSDVTWNPSVCSVLEDSLLCPTTEEHILPIIHGNDRVEWFIQISDEIIWNIEDKKTGMLRAKIHMRAGDVAAMPADIRHQGYSPKRSMLIVWENASHEIRKPIFSGKKPAISI